ncbi:MAG: oligosaccharide flippase family protein [Methylotenera sp.]
MIPNQNHYGIKKLFIHGVSWTFLGYAFSQVLRLASNLILARLLAPQDFGLIAIVTVFMIGIAMFSDVGLGPNIIQSERGEDEDFLNTAWTVQVIRGFLLWFACILLAWPMSMFYNQPELVLLIAVSGLAAVINGFNSTGIFSKERAIDLKKQTIYQAISQIAAILLMIAVAFVHASVWALVAGSLISALVNMILSHQLVPMRNKFCWDGDAVHSLITFGRWIFVSTMLGFFVNSGASLILGKFLSMTNLGLFSIGVTLSKLVEQIYSQIVGRIILPVYAKFKHLSNNEIRSRVQKLRLGIMVVFLPPLWVLIIFSHEIIALCFDPRYKGAGWIMQIFAASSIPIIISGLGPFYLALGDSLILMRITIVKAIVYFVSIYLGWLINGGDGIIYGMAITNALLYFPDVYAQIRYSIWIPKLDILGFGVSLLVISFGLYLN